MLLNSVCFGSNAVVLTRWWWRSATWFVCTLTLIGCQAGAAPSTPTPAPAAIVLLDDALIGQATAAGLPVVAIGYLLLETPGARLVAGLSFDPNGDAHVPEQLAAPIWLGSAVPASIQASARVAGSLRYATVLVRGAIDGPGSYGPSGQYKYQIAAPDLVVLAPTETSVAELLDRPGAYQSQLVRVAGGLLVRDTSAILAEALGAGGLPAPQSRQIKLRGPVHDQALLSRLKGAPSGAVRFGAVQVEGVLQDGALAPLAIRSVT